MNNHTGTTLLSITIAVLALLTLAVGVQARMNALDTSITITSRVHGNAPHATPIQAIINNDHRVTYELTGIARRNGDTMIVTLYQPLPEMLQPVTAHVHESHTSNPNARMMLTYMPIIDGGSYFLKNRDYPATAPATHLQPGDRQGSFVYVTQDITINNETYYPFEEGGVLHLQAGWNLIVHEYIDPSIGSSRQYVAPLDSLDWYWEDIPPISTRNQ